MTGPRAGTGRAPAARRPGREGHGRFSAWRLALASQIVEIAFTPGRQQRIGWEIVLGHDTRGRGAEAEGAGGKPDPVLPGPRAGALQTQPLVAGLVWGPALAAGRTDPELPGGGAAWERAETLLAPLVAASGDRIFHLSVPLVSGSGLVLLALFLSPLVWVWYPVLIAAGVLVVAAWSWIVGLRGEAAAVEAIASGRLERAGRILEIVGRALFGGALGLVLASAMREEGRSVAWGASLLLLAVVGAAARWGLPPAVRLLLLLGLGTLVGLHLD